MMNLAKNYGVELPISKAVYEMLYQNKDPKETLNGLFARSIKNEF